MAEKVFIRAIGGPRPGLHTTYDPWPLPDVLAVEGGSYVKVRQSQLQASESGLIARGAEYVWRPGAIRVEKVDGHAWYCRYDFAAARACTCDGHKRVVLS